MKVVEIAVFVPDGKRVVELHVEVELSAGPASNALAWKIVGIKGMTLGAVGTYKWDSFPEAVKDSIHEQIEEEVWRMGWEEVPLLLGTGSDGGGR